MKTKQKLAMSTKLLPKKQMIGGFTLIEMLVVIIMIGVLAAIAAPNLLGFLIRQRLNNSSSQVYQAIQQAQSRAQNENTDWQVSFRQQSGGAEWVVHRSNASYNFSTAPWNDLGSDINIDTSRTTAYANSSSIWQIQFNYQGNYVKTYKDESTTETKEPPVKITLAPQDSPQLKQCIIVQTLLGGVRSDRDSGCDESTALPN